MKISTFFKWVPMFIAFTFFGQENPVKFTVTSNQDTLVFSAKIEKGWHLYAAHLPHPNEGPLATEIIFNASPNFQVKGSIIEEKGIVKMDDAFGIDVKYFENATVFKQVITKNSTDSFNCTGTISYMVCNDQKCIPLDYSFTVPIK